MGSKKADWLSTGHDSISLDPKWVPAGHRRALISCWGWYWAVGEFSRRWRSSAKDYFLAYSDCLLSCVVAMLMQLLIVVPLEVFIRLCGGIFRDWGYLVFQQTSHTMIHLLGGQLCIFIRINMHDMFSQSHSFIIHSFRCFTISCMWNAKISRLDIVCAWRIWGKYKQWSPLLIFW